MYQNNDLYNTNIFQRAQLLKEKTYSEADYTKAKELFRTIEWNNRDQMNPYKNQYPCIKCVIIQEIGYNTRIEVLNGSGNFSEKELHLNEQNFYLYGWLNNTQNSQDTIVEKLMCFFPNADFIIKKV